MLTHLLNLSFLAGSQYSAPSSAPVPRTHRLFRTLLQAPTPELLGTLHHTLAALPSFEAREGDETEIKGMSNSTDFMVGVAANARDLETFASRANTVRSSYLFLTADWSVRLPRVAVQRLSGVGSLLDPAGITATAVQWVLANCIVITPEAARFIDRNPLRGSA